MPRNLLVAPASSAQALGGLALPLFALPLLALPLRAQSFQERAVEVGLDHLVLGGWDDFGTQPKVVRDWVQTGFSLGDLNGDGLLDVVALGGARPNAVLLQQGDGQFLPHASANIRSGELDRVPALGDYDRDGDLDLFIGALEGFGEGQRPARSRLYANDGTASFEDVTALSGTTGAGTTLHAIWADVDLDGWLDLYTSEFFLVPNQLYRNNADGTFTEIGAEVGVDDDGSAHASSVLDSDGNGWPDIFVGNDYFVGDIVDIPDGENQGDGHYAGIGGGEFQDVTGPSSFGQKRGIMGLAFGDVNYDGLLDVYKTDVGKNWLLLNKGWPTIEEPWEIVTAAYGVENAAVPFLINPNWTGPTSGWATMFLDVDLDSFVDLFVVNGHVAGVNPDLTHLPRLQPNALYRGLGPEANFAFEEATDAFGLYDRFDDRAGAMGDVDRDGDIDLLVAETAGRMRYFQNEVDRQGRGTLSVRVESGTSAPDGVGAIVSYTGADGLPRVRAIGADAPTASQNELFAHFGLGDETAIDLSVELPSGMVLALPNTPADSDLTVVEPTLFEVSTPKVAADGVGPDTLPSTVEIRVFPHDSSGNPLPSEAPVELDIPGMAPLTPIEPYNEGWKRRFAAPTTAGAHRVIARFDGWGPRVAPVIHAVGALDPALSTVRVDTEALRANSGDTVTVEVAPLDANGLGIGPGRTVAISAAGLVAGAPIEDLGDGRYRQSFTAAVDPGTFPVVATVDGVALTTQPTVEVAGDASGATTTLVVQPPRFFHAASPFQTKLTLIPRDAEGRRLGGQAEIEVDLRWVPSAVAETPDDHRGSTSPATGTPTSQSQSGTPLRKGATEATRIGAGLVWMTEGLETAARADGSYLLTVERDLQATEPSAKARIDVRVDGLLVIENAEVLFEF